MQNRNRQFTCRPCKEQSNWEIENPEGEVMERHYPTRQQCLEAALRYAEEYGCDLHICNTGCKEHKRHY